MAHRRIAAFDFDGTLTYRDTLVPFLVRAFGARRVAAAVSRTASTAARARLGRLEGELHHRDATKEALLADLFAGRDAAWVSAQGKAFATTLHRRLRSEMVEQVAWHRSEGHELVIVSAGLSAYLEPFARRHHFNQVMAVELETDESGTLTGALAGPNVRGPEKEVRLRAWFGDEPPEMLWAYGNSSGDRELLAMADKAVWVDGPNADRR